MPPSWSRGSPAGVKILERLWPGCRHSVAGRPRLPRRRRPPPSGMASSARRRPDGVAADAAGPLQVPMETIPEPGVPGARQVRQVGRGRQDIAHQRRQCGILPIAARRRRRRRLLDRGRQGAGPSVGDGIDKRVVGRGRGPRSRPARRRHRGPASRWSRSRHAAVTGRRLEDGRGRSAVSAAAIGGSIGGATGAAGAAVPQPANKTAPPPGAADAVRLPPPGATPGAPPGAPPPTAEAAGAVAGAEAGPGRPKGPLELELPSSTVKAKPSSRSRARLSPAVPPRRDQGRGRRRGRRLPPAPSKAIRRPATRRSRVTRTGEIHEIPAGEAT